MGSLGPNGFILATPGVKWVHFVNFSVGYAAAAFASAAAKAASSVQGQAGAAQRPKQRARRAGGRAGSAWTEDEVAQVVELGRTLRGITQLHRGNFSNT